MLQLLDEWRAAGSSRLDRDLDGVIDAGPGPGDLGRVLPEALAAVARRSKGLQEFVGTDSGEARDFTDGGFWYVEKDLGRLVGAKQATRSRSATARPRRSAPPKVWAALDAVPGDPDALRATHAERIAFRPGLLPTTIRFTNRPSGIQQVISFSGHRPR